MDYPRFDRSSPHTPLTEAELQQLDDWLIGLAEAGVDGVMTLDGMDGYLTALAVGPSKVLDELPTADWLPAIWGGDGPNGAPFPSNQKRKRTTVLVLRHLQSIASVLRAAPAGWEPVFSVVEHEGTEWADAGDWCTGFLQAVDLLPEAWTADWAAPSLAPLLSLGGGLEGTPSDPAPEDAEAIDALSRAVPEAVLGLRAGAAPA